MTQTDPPKPEVGDEIRRLRESSGMTQTELARRLNETLGAKYYQTTIGRIESGERSISLPEAAIISETLNVPITQLADLAVPPSTDRLCTNYALKINDATNSLNSASFSIKIAENLAENLKERIERAEQKNQEVPAYIKDLVNEIPNEVAAYESMRSSIEKMVDHSNFFFHRWLSGLNSAEDQEENWSSR